MAVQDYCLVWAVWVHVRELSLSLSLSLSLVCRYIPWYIYTYIYIYIYILCIIVVIAINIVTSIAILLFIHILLYNYICIYTYAHTYTFRYIMSWSGRWIWLFLPANSHSPLQTVHTTSQRVMGITNLVEIQWTHAVVYAEHLILVKYVPENIRANSLGSNLSLRLPEGIGR